MPPRMPNRALSVFFAISSPPGTEITTRKPFGATMLAAVRRASSMACAIICRGTGLMAGAPTSRPSPGLVTRPTPAPPSIKIPAHSFRFTVEMMCARWVQSGSSPASFTTSASADPPRTSHRTTANVTFFPMGSVISTLDTGFPASIASVAAFVAAGGGGAGSGGEPGPQSFFVGRGLFNVHEAELATEGSGRFGESEQRVEGGDRDRRSALPATGGDMGVSGRDQRVFGFDGGDESDRNADDQRGRHLLFLDQPDGLEERRGRVADRVDRVGRRACGLSHGCDGARDSLALGLLHDVRVRYERQYPAVSE